jgi:hypothetical protein
MNTFRIPLVAAALAGCSLASTIGYTGVNAEQQYTVTESGEYQIIAAGAQGGNAVGEGAAHPVTAVGGLGAEIGGDFTLTQGEMLYLYIGEQAAATGIAAGGGGGTFITLDSGGIPGTLLVAAGGGGGAARSSAGAAATTGNSGPHGGTADNSGGAGGGGGYQGNGATPSGGNPGENGTGGNGFPSLRGGTGDPIYYGTGAGGYGGGGGGSIEFGGGGGGYTGGNGGGSAADPTTGGGSYIDASATDLIQLVNNTGNGYVEINLVQAAPPTVPEPATFALLSLGLLALRFRRRA